MIKNTAKNKTAKNKSTIDLGIRALQGQLSLFQLESLCLHTRPESRAWELTSTYSWDKAKGKSRFPVRKHPMVFLEGQRTSNITSFGGLQRYTSPPWDNEDTSCLTYKGTWQYRAMWRNGFMRFSLKGREEDWKTNMKVKGRELHCETKPFKYKSLRWEERKN